MRETDTSDRSETAKTAARTDVEGGAGEELVSAPSLTPGRRALAKELLETYNRQEAGTAVSHLLSEENFPELVQFASDMAVNSIAAIESISPDERAEIEAAIRAELAEQPRGELYDKLLAQELMKQQISQLPTEQQAQVIVQNMLGGRHLSFMEDFVQFAAGKLRPRNERRDALGFEMAAIAEDRGKAYALSDEGVREAHRRVFGSAQEYLEWALGGLNINQEILQYMFAKLKEEDFFPEHEKETVAKLVDALQQTVLDQDGFLQRFSLEMIDRKIAQIFGEHISFSIGAVASD